MTVKFKNQKPIHPSRFIQEENSQNSYQSHFLGNATSRNNESIDLYFIIYKDGEVNAAYQFGNEESEYGSGFSVAYEHLSKNINSEYVEIYKRAIEAGLIKETTYYAGYSDIYAEELYEEYQATDYYQGRPNASTYYGKSKPTMSTLQFEEAIEAYDIDIKKYNDAYKQEYKSIPKSPGGEYMHVFSDLDEARTYCPMGKGRFKQFKAINHEHLQSLFRKEDFQFKIRQDQEQLKNPVSEETQNSL
jgi:hypothetical protein